MVIANTSIPLMKTWRPTRSAAPVGLLLGAGLPAAPKEQKGKKLKINKYSSFASDEIKLPFKPQELLVS